MLSYPSIMLIFNLIEESAAISPPYDYLFCEKNDCFVKNDFVKWFLPGSILLDDAFNMIIFYSLTSLLWEDGILGMLIYVSCFFVYFNTSMLRIG